MVVVMGELGLKLEIERIARLLVAYSTAVF